MSKDDSLGEIQGLRELSCAIFLKCLCSRLWLRPIYFPFVKRVLKLSFARKTHFTLRSAWTLAAIFPYKYIINVVLQSLSLIIPFPSHHIQDIYTTHVVSFFSDKKLYLQNIFLWRIIRHWYRLPVEVATATALSFRNGVSELMRWQLLADTEHSSLERVFL